MSAVNLLREAEALSHDEPYAVRRLVLENLARVTYELGRLDDSLEYFEALASLARQQQDLNIESYARSSALLAKRKQMEEWPEPGRLPELLAEARECLALAEETGNLLRRAPAHRSLADLLAASPTTRAEAEPHYRTALALSRQINTSQAPREIGTSQWLLGRYLFMFGKDFDQATNLIDGAVAAAVKSKSATNIAYAWRQKMRLAWRTLPREMAISESRRALDAIERLQGAQSRDRSRAEVTSAWSPDYYWFAGQMLQPQAPTHGDIQEAFGVYERMRARMLLDSLHASGTSDTSAPTQESTRRQALLDGITQLQQQLLVLPVRGPNWTAVVARIEALEREEEALRAVVAERVGSTSPSAGPVSLGVVQRVLREDEALLYFAVGIDQTFYGEFDGGSWLLVVTASGARVIRLPDRIKLHPMVSVFRGFVEDHTHTDATPSIKLYDLLLKEALAAIPKTVRRLILIPDGPLHHLPFSVLRAEPGAAPLGRTHELLIAPSASVWVRLKQQAPRSISGASLVLADPAFNRATSGPAIAAERGWSLDAMPAGSLPHARTEGRSVLAQMPGGGRLLEGADASEAALKQADSSAFGVLHFATHALVDEAHPDRSAVVLAGTAAEDGLLQAREISDLRLRGCVVVLSACRSATGAVLAGEGVLGLSRSFFEAGARTVIGTLWPIRDNDAATFFALFYESLGGGQTVGTAMTSARNRAIDRGLPASVWASFIVMGNDDVAVASEAERSNGSAMYLVGVTVLLAIVAALLWWSKSPGLRSDARPQ